MNDYTNDPLRYEVGGLASNGLNASGPRLATPASLGIEPRQEPPQATVLHPEVDLAALRLLFAAARASSVEWTGLAQTFTDLASILQALPAPDAAAISAALLGND